MDKMFGGDRPWKNDSRLTGHGRNFHAMKEFYIALFKRKELVVNSRSGGFFLG